MGFFKRLSSGLKKTKDNFVKKIESAFKGEINDDLFDELEEILITSDVGVKTAEIICEKLRKNIKEKGIKEANVAVDELKAILIEMLSGDMEGCRCCGQRRRQSAR